MPGFLVNGFREIGRKSTRFGLRRHLAAHDRQRKDALAALGRAAWKAGIDLAAFGEQRDRLQTLDARAGELTATAARLEQERAALEARRQAEAARFDALLQPARAKLAEAEAALKAARAALAEQEKAAKAAGAAAGTATTPLAADVAARTAVRTQAAGEVSRLESEKAAALAPLDADLKRVREEASGATRESASVGREQVDRYRGLGLALYDAKTAEPALAGPVEAVAAIDRDRGATQGAIDASLALTAGMPRGTMAKFWATLLLPLMGLAAGYMAYSRFTAREPTGFLDTAAARPGAGSSGVQAEELRKDETVKAFLASKKASEREKAVAVLEADLMEIGSSADRAGLPLLAEVLKRGEPELRAAAAQAIGMIGPTRTEFPMLAEALNDPAPSVRDAAGQALDQIDDPAARLLVRRMRTSSPGRPRSRAEGLAPTELPDASSLGMPIYPGATFLRFASDLAAGRVTFSSADPIDKVRQFYEKAAGRIALSGEEYSRAYLGATTGDPAGAERAGRETETWIRDAMKSGRSPDALEKEMTRRAARLADLPLVRYADPAIYRSPVFVGFDAPSSDGTPVRGPFVAVFEDRSLGRTGFALHLREVK